MIYGVYHIKIDSSTDPPNIIALNRTTCFNSRCTIKKIMKRTNDTLARHTVFEKHIFGVMEPEIHRR